MGTKVTKELFRGCHIALRAHGHHSEIGLDVCILCHLLTRQGQDPKRRERAQLLDTQPALGAVGTVERAHLRSCTKLSPG